jgi:hypothetical protein
LNVADRDVAGVADINDVFGGVGHDQPAGAA